MEESKNVLCPHMDLIKPLEDEKFLKKAFLDCLSKNLFKCQKCSSDYNSSLWLCLHDKCEYVGCGPYPVNEKEHFFTHYNESKTSDIHCLFINVSSYKIICIDCNQEIYDLETYSENEHQAFLNWPNPRAIRSLLMDPDHRIFKENLSKTELTNPKVHWKSTKGLCGLHSFGNTDFINSVLQAWSNISAIKKIFKKMFKGFTMMGMNKNLPTRSNSLKLIYEFSRFIHKVWFGKWRVYDAKSLVFSIYKLNPGYRSYGFHDAFEMWKILAATIHNEYKYPMDPDSNIFIDDEWKVIKNPEKFQFSSLISKIFSFPIHEIYKCGECDSFLQKIIRQSYEISIDLAEMKEEVKKSLTEPSTPKLFYLNDILTYFFYKNSSIKTPSTFKHICPKCKMIPETLSQTHEIKSYPNVLVIHLNRFSGNAKENIFVDFPLDELSLNDFFKDNEANYEFLSLIEHSTEKSHEKFRTIIKHHKNQSFFLMDDTLVSRIDQKFVQERQAYILVYQLKTSKQENNLRHNISSQKKLLKEKQVKLDDKDLMIIPNYWYEKFMTLKNPGKIDAGHYICPHFLIKPEFYDCFPFPEFKSCKDYTEFYRTYICLSNSEDDPQQHFDVQINRSDCRTRLNLQRMTFESVSLPKAIIEYLIEIFGGKNLVKNLNICQKCLIFAQNIRQRKIMELHLIEKYENKENCGFAIIEKGWYHQWRTYLYARQRFSPRHFIKGYPIPDAINNQILLLDDEEKLPLHDLKKDQDYVVVNSYIWEILEKIYTGGPAILRKNNTIYSESISSLETNLSENDEEMIKKIRFLGDENNAVDEKEEEKEEK